MGSKIFLDQLLGSFQFFEPFSGSSKLLFIDLNLAIATQAMVMTCSVFLVMTSDSLVSSTNLWYGLEIMEMILGHLLLYLFPLAFLSGEEFI